MKLAISGVNRGIGESLTRRALTSGHEVTGFGRQPPAWAAEHSAKFSFIECDMADPSQLESACSSFADSIDVLVCNAATFAEGAGTIEWFHPTALSEAFAVNTIAPLLMARGLKKNLEAGGRRHIVMMSTGNASLEGNTTGSMLGYRLSKTALNQAVRNLAAEWGGEGFSIVALNPGWVQTDMGGPNAELTVEQAASDILHFIEEVSRSARHSGCFVNVDGSPLPW